MKTFCTLLILLFPYVLIGQDCSELFFSEYVEGSSQNKALEIYNPTNQIIDLSNYTIERFSNGSIVVSDEMLLSGYILPGQTWVVTISDTNSTNEFGFIQIELYNMANQLAPLYPSPLYYNGNDALVLSKNDQIIDIIGKVGEDPGSSWTDDPTAGFTDANGGAWWTKDKTLVRKVNVKSGVMSNPVLFDPTSEWDSLAMNTFNNLGFHNCDCNPQINSFTCTLDGCIEIIDETGDYSTYDECINDCSNIEPLCSEYPEFTNTTFNPYPDTLQNLDTAFYGQYYEEYILFYTPNTVGDILSDPYQIDGFGFPVNIAPLAIDSILFVDIVGLPNSFNFEFSNPDGLYFPNTLGCIKISGTAQEDEIGNYDLSILINGWINFSFIGTISFYETIGSYEEYTGYTLIINSALESTWNCINNACVDPMDGSGIYDDLNECEAICNSVIEDSWNCVNNACVDPMDGSGIYDDLNECEQACQNISSVNEASFEIRIYPNPSSDIFNIELSSDSETEILVTNILGEKVYNESIKSIKEYNTQIDISDYSKGIYNLTIKTSDGISNYKLILQ